MNEKFAAKLKEIDTVKKDEFLQTAVFKLSSMIANGELK